MAGEPNVCQWGNVWLPQDYINTVYTNYFSKKVDYQTIATEIFVNIRLTLDTITKKKMFCLILLA